MNNIPNFLYCLFLIILLQYTVAYGQTKKNEDVFPTYEQIRQNGREIYDHVYPQAVTSDPLPRYTSYSLVKRSPYFGAFDFPADSVVYYLNGRRIKNKKKAEKEIKENAQNVDHISIGEPGANGRREIRIDYEPSRKKD